MKRAHALLLGLGLFSLALLMTVPASLLRKVLPEALEVGRFEGTLWQGRAEQIHWQGEAVLDGLDWDWRTARLLGLQLVFDLRTRWQGEPGQARVVAGLSALTLQDADLTVPLDPVLSRIPELARYQLRGNLKLLTPAFSWSEGRGDGILTADWLQARSDFSGDAVMGDYRIALKAVAKGYAVKVETLQGMLKISGDGTGSPGQGWNVGAVLQAPPGQMPQFQNLLARMGPPTPDGRYLLRYSFK